MNIKVFSLPGNDKTNKTVDSLKDKLTAAGLTVTEQNPDLIITVGGDGTLLSAVHENLDILNKVSFIGLHTGHLGFFSDWVTDEQDQLVSAIKNQKPTSSIFPLVQADIFSDKGQQTVFALNEIAIRRITNSLSASVFVDGHPIEHIRGDGLVISTPLGSTAYNKSIGGAVVDPSIPAFQMSEVASINNNVYRSLGSPMVFSQDTKVTIEPEINEVEISYDNQHVEFNDIKKIEFSVSNKSVKFLSHKDIDFWTRVQKSFIGNINK